MEEMKVSGSGISTALQRRPIGYRELIGLVVVGWRAQMQEVNKGSSKES